jgi:hypothetical protein
MSLFILLKIEKKAPWNIERIDMDRDKEKIEARMYFIAYKIVIKEIEKDDTLDKNDLSLGAFLNYFDNPYDISKKLGKKIDETIVVCDDCIITEDEDDPILYKILSIYD